MALAVVSYVLYQRGDEPAIDPAARIFYDRGLHYLDEESGKAKSLDDAIQKVDEAELQEMLHATVEGYKPTGATPAAGATDDWQPASRTLH